MSGKRKVAILGGGIGGLAAAMELTDDPVRREEYEITVYQMGWRLGGKGASTRDPRPGYGGRILEHGLHVWGGFYHYSFRQLRAACDEVGVDWGTLFRQQSHITLQEWVDGRWEHWPMKLYAAEGLPGDGEPLPTSARVYIARLVGWVRDFFRMSVADVGFDLERLALCEAGLPEDIAEVCRRCHVEEHVHPATGTGEPLRPEGPQRWEWFLDYAAAVVRKVADVFDDDDPTDDDTIFDTIAWLLDRTADGIDEPQNVPLALREWRRRFRILLDIARTVVRGARADGVLTRGFDAIDHVDLIDWLHHHGLSEEALNSPIVRGGYEYCFAFVDGDPARPSQGAGTALRGTLRLLFASKGAVFWEMKGGMGEVVFLPFYRALVARGVRFCFFHRVDSLELGNDECAVERVRLGVQARVAGGPDAYRPLVTIGGSETWPDRPIAEQLEDGDSVEEHVERHALDFESPYPQAAWPDADVRVLQRGVDFDDVVLAIPPGDHRRICAALIEADDRWRSMSAALTTVPTMALQLWLSPTTDELGWLYGPSVVTAYEPPLATWADLSFLAEIEGWPAEARPGSVAYFCGTLPPEAPRDKAGANAWVRQRAEQWLQRHAAHLWPRAGRPFDFAFLVDPEDRSGAARLDSQYWRANVFPSERYVQHPPGSSRHRMHPADSGFDNLFLAGDWTRSGINAGCIEAAVMGGILAARGLYGATGEIAGETDI